MRPHTKTGRQTLPFGSRLRTSREVRGLTQTELAECAGFHPSAIAHFENGNRSPICGNLLRLADGLNVSTDFLLGRLDGVEHSRCISAGPIIDKLQHYAERLSQRDLQTLTDFARMLAEKAKTGTIL